MGGFTRRTALVLTLLLLAPALAALPLGGASTALPDGALPTPVVGAAAAAVDGVSYILGGRLANGSYSDAILRHDPATDQSTRVASLPSPRQSAAAVALGGKILLFGGAILIHTDMNGDGIPETVPKSVDEIVQFDPATGLVRVLVDRMPYSAWGLSAFADGARAYVLGGFTFDISNPSSIERRDDIARYDGSATEGTRMTLLPARAPYPVQDAAVAVADGHAWIVGGLVDHGATNPCPKVTYRDPDTGEEREQQLSVCATGAVSAFSIANETMSGVATFLPSRIHFAAATSLGGVVYVAAGREHSGDPSDAIMAIEPSQLPAVAQLAARLPHGTFGAAAATAESSAFHVYGGRIGGGVSDLTDAIIRVAPAEGPLASAPRALLADPDADARRTTLAWAAPARDGGAAVQSYRVWRTVEGEPETIRATVTGTSWTDHFPSPNTTWYRVAAVTSHGDGDSAIVRVASLSGVPPGAPRDVGATPQGLLAPLVTDAVELTWRAPLDDGGKPVESYRVWRAIGEEGEFLLIGEIRETTFDDTAPPTLRTLRYQITAVNAAGEGPRSDTARVEGLDAAIDERLP